MLKLRLPMSVRVKAGRVLKSESIMGRVYKVIILSEPPKGRYRILEWPESERIGEIGVDDSGIWPSYWETLPETETITTILRNYEV